MISLITSLYKSEKYLKKYLKKIRKFADFLSKNNIGFEIVIISNDPTIREKQELKKLKNLNKWVRIFYVSREPLYTSWNRGINKAQGGIIGFWNVDDIRYPEAIIDGIRLIKEGAELVYFPFIIKWYLNLFGFSVMVRKRIIHPPIFNQKEFTRSMHCGVFFIFTKSLYKKIGPFDEQFKIAGDFDWCIRAAKISDFKLSEKITGEFSVFQGALSSGKNPLREAENNVIYKRYKILDKINHNIDISLETKYNIHQIIYSRKPSDISAFLKR